MTVRRLALVSGHVQGVGYRAFVRRLAEAAGVSGSARNLPDGRVEVDLEGPGQAVDRLVAELDGPQAPGRVTGVDVRAEAPRGSRGFTSE
jgi:acylphosphatase